MAGHKLTTTARRRVRDHGYREGTADYRGRQDDVESGEAPSWAWPLAGAGEAYINAVGTETICKEVGVPTSAWDAIAELWCEAFVRGYREARAADAGQEGR